jgi:hypothetical protein
MDTSNPLPGNDSGLPKAYDFLRNPPLWEKAGQLRHLCRIGLAATDTNAVLDHMENSFEALFEVMHRLADEIENEVDRLDRTAGGIAE